MFCEKCGKPNADGARFCEHCGAPLNAAAPVATNATAAAAPAGPSIMDRAKALHKKNKFIFPGIAAIIVIAIALYMVIGAMGKQIKLIDYMKIEVTGYNGYGELEYRLDRNTLGFRSLGEKDFKAYGDCSEEKLSEAQREALINKYQKNETLRKKANKFTSSIIVNVELPEGKSSRSLSNGDVIKFELVYDEAAAKDLDLTIKSTTLEYTVSGLGEIAEYDLLKNFTVSFDGYDGIGEAELYCNKSEIVTVGDLTFETEVDTDFIRYRDKEGYTRTIYLYIDNDYNLSNGDTVRVYSSVDSEDYLASYGVKLANFSKDITVDGLSGYTDVDLLSHFSVNFTGVNGNGRAEVVPNEEVFTVGEVEFNLVEKACYVDGSYCCGIYVYISDSYSLKNGQVITLTLNTSEDALAKYGIKLISEPVEITIDALAEYATDVAQVVGKADELVEKAEQIVNDYINDSWSEAVHNKYFNNYENQYVGDDMVLYAMGLTTPKSSTSGTKNTVWYVFRVTLNDDDLEEDTYYYFAVSQNNVTVNKDGSLLATSEYMTKYRGYTDYEELVSKRIESYNLNSGIKVLVENPTEPA